MTYPILTIMFELAICREADSKITVTSLMKNLVAILLTFEKLYITKTDPNLVDFQVNRGDD